MIAPSLPSLRSGRSSLPLAYAERRVAELKAVAPEDAAVLSAWRYINGRWFLSEFPQETAATRTWIEAVRNTPDRLLLMVHAEGERVGTLGLRGIDRERREAEIDNVLRGRETPDLPGLMGMAVSTLAAWAADALGAQRLYLHVFRDNPARIFYGRLGFVTVGEPVGLSFVGTGGDGRWEPSTDEAERYLVRMELTIDGLTARNSRPEDRD